MLLIGSIVGVIIVIILGMYLFGYMPNTNAYLFRKASNAIDKMPCSDVLKNSDIYTMSAILKELGYLSKEYQIPTDPNWQSNSKETEKMDMYTSKLSQFIIDYSYTEDSEIKKKIEEKINSRKVECENNPNSIKKESSKTPIIITVLIIILIILGAFVYNFNSYKFDLNMKIIVTLLVILIIAYFAFKFRPKDELPEPVEENIPVRESFKEVFNISNNIFTYGEAENICRSYDGELASLDQVIDAYKNGANWCNYGWIKGNMAVYPTQQEAFDDLVRNGKSSNLECGLPGVNGGYFKDKKILFGATCYAVKPAKLEDNELLKKKLVSAEDYELHNKLTNLDKLDVLPFNDEQWSQ